MNNHCSTLFFILPILLLGTSVAVKAQDSDTQPIDVDAVARNLREYGTRMAKIRAALDQSRFEPDGMVEKLDFEADALIGFVVGEIVFQPYQGALRGPVGTLRAGAGNSLDQATLLALLLKSAGYDARVVRGTLSDQNAKVLLGNTKSAHSPNSLDYLQPVVEEALPESEPPRPGLAWRDTGLYKDARTISAELEEALGRSGIQLEPQELGSRWLPLVKEYFWVQYRLSASGRWLDVHPAFAASQTLEAIEPQQFFTSSVPATYHHTFTISAWVEQWVAGAIKRHRIMDDWTAPTANLSGVPLQFRNVPNGLSRDTAADLEAAVTSTSMLTPTLNGSIAPGAQVFDLKGRVIDPMAVSGQGGAAGFFNTLAEKLESATGATMEREGGAPLLALHSMYLEFTHTSPSGSTDTERRYLVPPRANYQGDTSDLVWPLITDHSYMLSTGGAPLDYLADRYLSAGIESLAWLDLMVRKTFQPEKTVTLPPEIPSDAPPLAQSWLMDRRPLLDGAIIAFRASPGLVGIRRGYRDASTAFAAVDVVWNHVEHLRMTETGLMSQPRAALTSGVWDTVLESVPAQAISEVNSISSAVRIFNLAQAQGIGTQVLKPGDSAFVDRFDIPDFARQFVKSDLANGYVVVVPERIPEGAPMVGWWRIDPRTGETLGLTGDGYGQDAVEYLMEVVGTAKSLVDALNSILSCNEQRNDVAKMCCLVEAHINNVSGLAFASLLGATTGTVTATLFDVVNSVGSSMGRGVMPSAKLGCEKMQATDW